MTQLPVLQPALSSPSPQPRAKIVKMFSLLNGAQRPTLLRVRLRWSYRVASCSPLPRPGRHVGVQRRLPEPRVAPQLGNQQSVARVDGMVVELVKAVLDGQFRVRVRPWEVGFASHHDVTDLVTMLGHKVTLLGRVVVEVPGSVGEADSEVSRSGTVSLVSRY